MYDQLMVELRNEDHASFTNFLRMPPAMFVEWQPFNRLRHVIVGDTLPRAMHKLDYRWA